MYSNEEMKYSGVVRVTPYAKQTSQVTMKKFKVFNKQIDDKGFSKMQQDAIQSMNQSHKSQKLIVEGNKPVELRPVAKFGANT